MHSKLLIHALQHFGVGKCPLQKNGVNSCQLPKIGVGSCSLQKFDIFGVEFCVLQSFWSGLWCGLQIFWSGLEVHSKKFGVDLRCTPKLSKWTLGALQIFGVSFECMIVYSKEVKMFGVERCLLQIYWSGQLSTATKF